MLALSVCIEQLGSQLDGLSIFRKSAEKIQASFETSNTLNENQHNFVLVENRAWQATNDNMAHAHCVMGA